MQVGRGKYGMQTMNQSLVDLVQRRLITTEDATETSSDPEELRNLLMSGGGPGRTQARPPTRPTGP